MVNVVVGRERLGSRPEVERQIGPKIGAKRGAYIIRHVGRVSELTKRERPPHDVPSSISN